jgi:hypothetical protein
VSSRYSSSLPSWFFALDLYGTANVHYAVVLIYLFVLCLVRATEKAIVFKMKYVNPWWIFAQLSRIGIVSFCPHS